ncbi:unnamed protein product [Mucor fragilis]
MSAVTKITQFPSTGERGVFKEVTIDAPTLKPHDFIMKMVACGVCHTDCVFMGSDGMVLGHEPVGRVVAVGEKVDNMKVGDLVGVSYLKWSCMECRYCLSGEDCMCERRVMFPEGNMNGFASHMTADSRWGFKIPEGMSPKDASVFMCAGITVFNAIYNAKILPTARVAVVGIGGLGHLALQFAKAWGCHVTAISHNTDKKEEALKFGAHDFLCSKDFNEEFIAGVEKYDMIIDTVSANIDFDQYMSLLKRNGYFYLIGLPDAPVTIQKTLPFLQNQLSLRASVVGGRYSISLMLEFAKRHNIKPMIEEYPLDLDGLHKAIDRCDKSKARYRAVLIAQDE